jgi:hypothetical protein
VAGSKNPDRVGGWSYNLFNNAKDPDKGGMPFIDIYVTDIDGKIAATLFEATEAALLSGRPYAFARFFKRKRDGVMTEKDREYGYSYESSYPLIGLSIWANLQSVKLPAWALPYADEGFSIEKLPKVYDLKL